MSKKILFCSLFILIFLISSKQDPNAKTWEQRDTTVSADSIIAAIDRGEDIKIASCEIFGALTKQGTENVPDTIKSYIDIQSCDFLDSVYFEYCYFMKRVEFPFNNFSQDVYFCRATFSEDIDIRTAIFRGEAWFSYTIFNKEAIFSWVTFDTSAWFNNCYFLGHATFFQAIFGGLAYFPCATFAEDADFSSATFRSDIYLESIKFKNIDISWTQLKGNLICNRPVYSKLMKNFEEKRMLDDADGVYLFLKDQERMEKPPYIRYPEYWFIQLTCGYGTKPQNTIYLSIGIILVLMLFYTKSNAIREIEKEFGHRRRRRKYRIERKRLRRRLYDALYFSVHTFIIGVVSDWHPTDEFLIKTKKIKLFKFRTLSMIEGTLGWILLVLFVVTLTRKFIR
jgi:hypothetical protein